MALSPCQEDTQQLLHDADCHSLMFRMHRLCLTFLWEAHQPAILTAGQAQGGTCVLAACLHRHQPLTMVQGQKIGQMIFMSENINSM